MESSEMMKQNRKQQGFTLIELMIVIAIIGILAAIAIPAYQDYTIRAQASEGLNLAGAAKAAVTEYYQDRGVFPTDNATAGLPAAATILGKYTASVSVGAGGAITVTPGVDANPNLTGVLTLVPVDRGGSIEWGCNTSTIQDKHLPAACR